mgnify:FL=1
MSTKNELRDQVLAEMNARRIDHKTYINSEWLLSEYETTLRKEQEEAYTKGYNAGLADGTGKPLLAIEQIREEAVAEAKRKNGAEKFIDGMVAATQWLIDNKHIAAGSELNRMMLAAIAPQNTKTDTTNNDKRDEDQHREQCEGRY